jgi:GNAT superfamily N-acetyltransferase
LFGFTDEKSDYIHLSDGGHFDNLGAYELIRRRCRYIVAADATTDRSLAPDNLANLLRLVRRDFGIRIEIDTTPLAESKDRLVRWHCAVGLIRYDDVDSQAVAGVLIYLYASLTGDEPPDVREYAHRHRSFPHETTLDQFFTEAQFESYRALGEHIVQEVFGEAVRTMRRDVTDPVMTQAEVRGLFTRVRRQWFPPPPEVDRHFEQAGQIAMDLQKDLRGGEGLAPLCHELYPDLADGVVTSTPVAKPEHTRDRRAEMHMVNQMLQAMELAWRGMKLDHYHAHPLNRGWMNTFRRWTTAPSVQRHWLYLRAGFSQDFVRFCEQALNMVPIAVARERLSRSTVADWTDSLREMDREFALEWAGQGERLGWLVTGRYIRDLVAEAVQFAARKGAMEPLVWLLFLKDGQQLPTDRPCGVVIVAPPYREAVKNLEFFMWLRGPYRNLGIGRQCIRPILDETPEYLSGTGAEYRLLAYYPDNGGTGADRLEKAMWMNFFFDHGFRSVPANDLDAFSSMVSLARELRLGP